MVFGSFWPRCLVLRWNNHCQTPQKSAKNCGMWRYEKTHSNNSVCCGYSEEIKWFWLLFFILSPPLLPDLEEFLGLGDFVPQLSGRAAEGTAGQNWNFLETRTNGNFSLENGNSTEERQKFKDPKKTWRKSLPQCFSPECSGDLFFVFAVIPQMISNTGAYTTADKCLVSCLQDNKCSSPLASLSLNVPTRFHVCFPVKADVQVKVTILWFY